MIVTSGSDESGGVKALGAGDDVSYKCIRKETQALQMTNCRGVDVAVLIDVAGLGYGLNEFV